MTYLYDGTFDGFLTCIYYAIKNNNSKINCVKDYQINILDEYIEIGTNKEFVNIVKNKYKNIMINKLYVAYLSNVVNKENIILEYLKNQNDLTKYLDFVGLIKKVNLETHKMKGFLRFKHINNEFYYAEYESDNNILIFLGNYFKKRMKSDLFIINDKRRKNVIVYKNNELKIMKDFEIKINYEDSFEDLFKTYFNSININERKNEKCQMNFMPKKYWKYMPEVFNE